MDHVAVLGPLAATLGFGRGGGPCRFHGTLSLSFGQPGIAFAEQQGRQVTPQMPLDVVGQHAEKDVGLHPIRQAVIDGPDL